jgi:folate-dependent tRNA-U54 methylase TrmFO/GidA
LDTGHAKLMVPFFPLEALRRIPGFENARYEDPYAGGLGNSIRYVGMAPRDDALKVKGIENLFCAGEKAGLLVGHTEAIITGTLAGHNAARYAKREKPLILPTTIAIGDAISYVRTQMETEEGLGNKYTFSGSVYFERMKQKGLYSIDRKEIQERVRLAGVSEIFSSK